jgi:hypothetical protein
LSHEKSAAKKLLTYNLLLYLHASRKQFIVFRVKIQSHKPVFAFAVFAAVKQQVGVVEIRC